MISGEEVITKVVEVNNGDYHVKSPAILLPAGQGKLALVPWLPYAEAETMTIPSKIVGFVVEPKPDLVREYTNMTSGLLLPNGKMSTPKLTLVE